MTRFYSRLIAILFILFLCSCVSRRPFAASSFEPVTVEKKGDIEFSASARSFRYYSLGLTLTPTNFMAIRAGFGGFFDVRNINGSLIFFKNYSRIGFFVAPTFNRQLNVSQGHSGLPLFSINNKNYRYNCEYFSPALVLGTKFGTSTGKFSQQFIFKAQYNYVKQYQYYYNENNGSGLDEGYEVYDDETLNFKLKPFFSFEPSYAAI